MPTAKRNDILVQYLKSKLSDPSLSTIKKKLKLIIAAGKVRGNHLEKKLYELERITRETKAVSLNHLSDLMIYLHDDHGFASKTLDADTNRVRDTVYMSYEHIKDWECDVNRQCLPLVVFVQSKRIPALMMAIEKHGWFTAKVNAWDEQTFEAEIALHPIQFVE